MHQTHRKPQATPAFEPLLDISPKGFGAAGAGSRFSDISRTFCRVIARSWQWWDCCGRPRCRSVTMPGAIGSPR
jgi:hypothetical protein